jgi:predicted metal-dependent hydrolase
MTSVAVSIARINACASSHKLQCWRVRVTLGQIMKWKTLLADLDESKDRGTLKKRIDRLLAKWEPILGVTINSWELRKMKTYWGSANNQTGHIIFNTELAKLPPKYIEYIVVHELVHQVTDGHDGKFYKLMDQHLPGWRKMQAKIEEPLTRYS